MIVVAIINSLAVFFAFFSRHESMKFSLKIAFLLIFLLLSLRFNYGNDYHQYLYGFLEINKNAVIDYFDKSWYFEIGWLFLCRLFEPFGFFVLVAVLALFNSIVYYNFIKKFVPRDYYWFAVFIYVFNPGLMLIQCSAMRQTVAVLLFIYSIEYLCNKDAIRYFLCIGLASLFHTSALVLLPVFFIGFFDRKIPRIVAAIILASFIFLFLYGESILPFLGSVIFSYFNKYARYSGGADLGSGLGMIYFTILFAFVLHYEAKQEKQIAILFRISILFFLIMPLTFYIIMLGRIGIYLEPLTLVVFPIVLSNIRNIILKNAIMVVLIYMTLFNFYHFMNSSTFKGYFGTYQTIFSSPIMY